MSTFAPPPVMLERAGGDDLDSVMRIVDDAFDPRFGEAWTRAQCAGILPMSGVTLLLARERSDPVGFSLSRHVADEAELLLLGVASRARGRGIGRLLVQRFVEDQVRAGAHHLHLEVRDGNPAVDLYLQQRFKIAGRRTHYYKGPAGELFDALTMVRKV